MLLTLLFFKTNIFNCPISNIYCVLPINAFKIIALALPFSNTLLGGNMCLVWTYICLACGKLSVPKKEWKKRECCNDACQRGTRLGALAWKDSPDPCSNPCDSEYCGNIGKYYSFFSLYRGLHCKKKFTFLTLSCWIGINKFSRNICLSYFHCNGAYTTKCKFMLLTCVSSLIGTNKFSCNILNIVVLYFSLFPYI